MNRFALLLVTFAATAVAANDLPASTISEWCLKTPPEQSVLFRGIANLDAAGNVGAPIMYPAPNLVGALAAVLTHGVLMESSKAAEKAALEDSANQVLAPYRSTLSKFTQAELMQRGLTATRGGGNRKFYVAGEAASGRWQVESEPTFLMTPDERAIIIENLVTIYAPNNASEPAYRNTVRIVSKAVEDEKPAPNWLANEGLRLRQESIHLFSMSLDMAINDAVPSASQSATPVFKTIRYREGRDEKIERAQLLSEQCDRKLVKTLRGWLLSVPVAPSGEGTNCTQLAEQK